MNVKGKVLFYFLQNITKKNFFTKKNFTKES